MEKMTFQKDIVKNKKEIIRIELSEFQGQMYINIRAWYLDRDIDAYKPTQKGITLRPSMYPQLKAAILELGLEPEIESVSQASEQ